MNMNLGKEQILQCFDALNQKLAEHDQHGEILVCGGASMALLFDHTTVTKDIDAVILSTEMKNDISRYAAEVGAEQGLDEGWFNEAAKGYMNFTWERREISTYSNLDVYSVPAEQLLAMKLCAARTDTRDMEDSIKLMHYLGLKEVDEALHILERNMPERLLTIRNTLFTQEAFAEYQEREQNSRAMEKRRLFIDMDGTLAVFTPVDTLETLYEKGYYANLKPHAQVIEGIRQFMQSETDYEVYVLSAVLEDSLYAEAEKQEWLNQHLPEIDQAHRIFIPCGQDKSAYVPDGINDEDVLLDDYSKNLHQWEAAGGTGIKLMNAINGSYGSWRGKRIHYDVTAERFCYDLKQQLNQREESLDLRDYWQYPAKYLPGYCWEEYADGSGSLTTAEGKKVAEFDKATGEYMNVGKNAQHGIDHGDLGRPLLDHIEYLLLHEREEQKIHSSYDRQNSIERERLSEKSMEGNQERLVEHDLEWGLE